MGRTSILRIQHHTIEDMAEGDGAAKMEDIDLTTKEDTPTQSSFPSTPLYATSRKSGTGDDFVPLVTVVDFHHAR